MASHVLGTRNSHEITRAVSDRLRSGHKVTLSEARGHACHSILRSGRLEAGGADLWSPAALCLSR